MDSELKKAENVAGFLLTWVENEAWDSGIQRLLNLGEPVEKGQ